MKYIVCTLEILRSICECQPDGKPQTLGDEAQISKPCGTESRLFHVAMGYIGSGRNGKKILNLKKHH